MSRSYSVTITRYAQAQLREIGRYIAFDLFAPEAAQEQLQQLRAAAKSLARLPARFPLVDREPWRSEGIRKMVIGNYLLYYWIDEEKQRVSVTAVIHVRSDQAMQLAEMMMNL